MSETVALGHVPKTLSASVAASPHCKLTKIDSAPPNHTLLSGSPIVKHGFESTHVLPCSHSK